MSATFEYDTGPLNWVRADIDAALAAALGRIQAYSVDADLTNALRLARDDAHQATGALRMVGLEGAATLAGTLEACLDDVSENRLPADDAMLRALRNALEGLQRWVKDLADGRGSGELALFPLYKRLRELQGAEQVFEGELFFPDLRAQMSGKPVGAGLSQEALAAEVKTIRAQFQRGLLAFLRNNGAEQGLRRMRDALAEIERIVPSEAAQTFWWACVGFLDSLIAHGVEADIHVKKLLARVDLQMRRLMEGSPEVGEKLMREALFFVAKSQAIGGRAAEVRSALGLDRYLPGRGMLDPETLARMRPVLDTLLSGIKSARDSWHAYVEGDDAQMEQFQTQLTRMQPQAQMLEQSGLLPLLGELGAAAQVSGTREGEAREQTHLEVAATLLLMQNGVESEDVLHADFAARSDNQQARLRALIEGRELPASIVETATQREAERDMLVHMAQEVGQNLRQMEEALDAFFRDASEREALAGLPTLAQQAQGALTMLELPAAAELLAAATAETQAFVSEGEPDEATQNRLADAFSSLGLFVESYCAGRSDAATILRPALIEFGLLDPNAVAQPVPAAPAPSALSLVEFGEEDAAKKKLVDAPAETGGADEPAARVIEAAPEAQPEPWSDETAAEVQAPVAVPADSVPEAAAPAADAEYQVGIPEDTEPELLEIFLEEAGEVLANMGEAASVCQNNPDDHESLTVVRRGFHTLKGSGRMVGLADFGETAWRHEQLMNGWLAENKSATAELMHLVEHARGLFQAWVDALKTNEPVMLPLAAWLAAVDRVAEGRPLGDVSAQTAGPVPTAASQPDEDTLPEIDANAWASTETTEPVYEQPATFAPEVAPEPEAEPVATGETLTGESFGAEAIEPEPVVSELEIGGVPAGDVAEEAAIEISVLALPEVGAVIEYAVPPEPVEAELPVEPVEPAVSDEICIGPICLSAGLYEIFITEAHQRLAVLKEEAERLAETPGSAVSEHARRAIHTLAGIAGTASITALSELSHAFELYWNRFSHAALPVSHLSLVQDTVVRLHDMVASIERGELPESAQDLIATLGELEDEQPVVTEEAAPAAPAAEAPPPEAAPATEAPAPAAKLDVSGMVPEARVAVPSPVFERREVADEIDEQLLPIFLEEAESLVPDTAAQLRAWSEAPTETAARDALRRNLHTIKGSARMVGAMRLGELTHVMESRVIAVIEGQMGANREIFDTLEAQLDRVADGVERMKRGERVSLVDEPAPETPLQAPIEPVLTHSETAHGVTITVDTPAIAPAAAAPQQTAARDATALTLRVRADWVDRMVNQAGEVAIARSRIESEVFAFKRHVGELSDALARLRGHIREVEIQAESQMQATFMSQGSAEKFDPLEFDRFTRFQEVTRFLAESVNDISTVQHILIARLGEADAALIQQTRLNRELQQDLLRVRMVPLHSVSDRLYRTVRQTARDVDKRAQLDIQGGELEIDRSVLEKVTAPLEHLLRNALAHGVEAPDVRVAAGKPEFGEIVLTARQSGNEMVITVQDDGAGLNYARIREKAEAQGLLLPGVEPTESLLAQMIFAAGFSTAETVSQVAGRGVGMDVVKSEISALGGRIDISSTPGVGTTFNIYLPLTLAMTQAVMVHAARHDYALPTTLVQQVLELKPAELEDAMKSGEVAWRGARYPFSYLPHLLGDIEAVHEVQRYNPVVLMQSGTSLAATLVDSIEGTREIVVKNIGPQLARITGVAGATVRGDGRVMLILNPVPLAQRWASQPRSAMERAAPAEAVELSAALQPPMVLVVDDSLTVRKITTRLLTREGFRVDSAKDGVDALEKMHDLVPDVVLLDVEMPRMDGFELARVMRADPRLKAVPIIMITSRTADKHRNHAMEIGVNVYLGKPYQEQQLLDHIAQQLGQEVVESI
ncbi:MAG: Hpt domain-containing protein [Gammaproteobacteria bacterium]